MTANAGYHAYTTGDVLTAAQVQYNLQNQTVMYFATSAARTTALSGVIVEGMVTYIPANGLEYYNGSAWVTLSTGGDITGVTAGTGISGGGTSGTVTVTNDMATTITTKGDLVPGTGSGTYSRLGVGANNTILTADSTAATGLKWAAASSGALTYITGASFSAVASVSLPNSTFTSTYANYKMIVNLTSAGGTAGETRVRMRASGTDDTGANYYMGGLYANYAGGNGAVNTTAGTYIPYGSIAPGTSGLTSQSTQFEMNILNPQVSNQTTLTAIGGRGSWTWTSWAGFYNASTAFDALTYYVDAGTITGNYRVYGIANS